MFFNESMLRLVACQSASSLTPNKFDNCASPRSIASIIAGKARKRRRKLRVDQEEQNLFRRDNGMVRLPRSKGQNRIDISAFKIRIFLKDRLSRLAG